MPKVEISPGPSLPTTFEARIAQPQTPTPSTMPPVALVEIETAAQLIPGPRGSTWHTGTGAPGSIPGQQDLDMYLDNATDHVWQLQGGVWVDTGTDLHGSPDTGSDILTKLLPVDGAGSGLDADYLDGQHASYFAPQVALDAETSARVAGDNTLQSNINSEASTRAAADTTLQSNINAEATTRANADTVLQTNINAKLDSATAAATYAPIASPTFTGDPKAPTPATSDNDTSLATTAFVKAVIAGLPPSGIPEAPNDGQQYARQSLAWAAVAIPPGTAISDTPPASPQNGQLWFESDSGCLYIFMVDAGGAPGQWVQVNGPTPAGPPQRQTLYPTSTGFMNIPVPGTAKQARIRGALYGATPSLAPAMRFSLDGSTFVSGASDYVSGGTVLYTGSSASPAKIAMATNTYWALSAAAYTDRTDTPIFIDVDVVVAKTAGSTQMFSFRSRSWVYHTASTAAVQEALMGGYSTTQVAASQLAALQIIGTGGSFATNHPITVDWVY